MKTILLLTICMWGWGISAQNLILPPKPPLGVDTTGGTQLDSAVYVDYDAHVGDFRTRSWANYTYDFLGLMVQSLNQMMK